MRKFTILALLALCGSSCKDKEAPIIPQVEAPKKYAELDQASWLLGRWEQNSAEGNFSETWTQKNDSIFSGRTHFVVGKDTVMTENIELAEMAGKLVYSATVSNQNNGKPVMFKSITNNGEKMAFENQAHDFPQRIIYNRISADSVMVEISGVTNDKKKSEEFQMRRIR